MRAATPSCCSGSGWPLPPPVPRVPSAAPHRPCGLAGGSLGTSISPRLRGTQLSRRPPAGRRLRVRPRVSHIPLPEGAQIAAEKLLPKLFDTVVWTARPFWVVVKRWGWLSAAGLLWWLRCERARRRYIREVRGGSQLLRGAPQLQENQARIANQTLVAHSLMCFSRQDEVYAIPTRILRVPAQGYLDLQVAPNGIKVAFRRRRHVRIFVVEPCCTLTLQGGYSAPAAKRPEHTLEVRVGDVVGMLRRSGPDGHHAGPMWLQPHSWRVSSGPLMWVLPDSTLGTTLNVGTILRARGTKVTLKVVRDQGKDWRGYPVARARVIEGGWCESHLFMSSEMYVCKVVEDKSERVVEETAAAYKRLGSVFGFPSQIVAFKGCMYTQAGICVMLFEDYGEFLSTFLADERQALSAEDVDSCATDLVTAVATMHEVGLHHLVLSPSHVRVKRDGLGRLRLKVSNLGSAEQPSQPLPLGFEPARALKLFLAPELQAPGRLAAEAKVAAMQQDAVAAAAAPGPVAPTFPVDPKAVDAFAVAMLWCQLAAGRAGAVARVRSADSLEQLRIALASADLGEYYFVLEERRVQAMNTLLIKRGSLRDAQHCLEGRPPEGDEVALAVSQDGQGQHEGHRDDPHPMQGLVDGLHRSSLGPGGASSLVLDAMLVSARTRDGLLNLYDQLDQSVRSRFGRLMGDVLGRTYGGCFARDFFWLFRDPARTPRFPVELVRAAETGSWWARWEIGALATFQRELCERTTARVLPSVRPAFRAGFEIGSVCGRNRSINFKRLWIDAFLGAWWKRLLELLRIRVRTVTGAAVSWDTFREVMSDSVVKGRAARKRALRTFGRLPTTLDQEDPRVLRLLPAQWVPDIGLPLASGISKEFMPSLWRKWRKDWREPCDRPTFETWDLDDVPSFILDFARDQGREQSELVARALGDSFGRDWGLLLGSVSGTVWGLLLVMWGNDPMPLPDGTRLPVAGGYLKE